MYQHTVPRDASDMRLSGAWWTCQAVKFLRFQPEATEHLTLDQAQSLLEGFQHCSIL